MGARLRGTLFGRGVIVHPSSFSRSPHHTQHGDILRVRLLVIERRRDVCTTLRSAISIDLFPQTISISFAESEAMKMHQLAKLLFVCAMVGVGTLTSPSLAQREEARRGGARRRWRRPRWSFCDNEPEPAGRRAKHRKSKFANSAQGSRRALSQAVPRSQSAPQSAVPQVSRRDLSQSVVPNPRSSDGQNTARTFRQNDTSQSRRGAGVGPGATQQNSLPRNSSPSFEAPPTARTGMTGTEML